MQKGVIAMSLFWERPAGVEVVTKTNDENPFAFLRNAIVGRVEELGEHVIGASFPFSFSGLAFCLQTREMVCPVFILKWRNLRELELELYVREVVGEGCARQALHVFNNECLWS